VFTETEARQAFDRVLPVFEDVPLGDVNLVVEAAVEKPELKKQIFATIDSKVQCETLATNTSALSIDAIADGLAHPERLVGIHFFNPVHRMQLVEVVVGPRTGTIAQVTAIQFVKGIGKLPVVVKDSPGFLVNRILVPYMAEAIRIFSEGYRVEKIDQLMLDFGMPMGPLRLNDEVGLDVSQHVAKDLMQRIKRLAPLEQDLLERMMAKGWLGRKSGRGFYEYSGRRAERPNPQLNREFQPAEPSAVDETELRDRLVLGMVNEAVRCLEEGVCSISGRCRLRDDHGHRLGTVPGRPAQIRRFNWPFGGRQPAQRLMQSRRRTLCTLRAAGRDGQARHDFLFRNLYSCPS